MKLTKTQLEAPFDIDLFYPDRNTKGYVSFKLNFVDGYNILIVKENGECENIDSKNRTLDFKVKTNLEYVKVAHVFGILNKNDYL